jgi:hypothetical protein
VKDGIAAREAERKRRYEELRRAAVRIDPVRPGATETAVMLLAEIKASLDRTTAGSANIEAKATVLLGIVSGTAGALGLFGAHDGKAVPLTPLVAVALILVTAALACLLYVLRAKRARSPNIHPYVSAATLRRDNRLGLTLILSEHYARLRAEIRAETRTEARVLFAAYAAVTIAAMALLAGVLTTSASPKRPNVSARSSAPTAITHPRGTIGP